MSDTAPAIRRQATDRDRAQVRQSYSHKVQFHRGLGDLGTRVEVVEPDPTIRDDEPAFRGCPHCGHDRMVRSVDLSPNEAPVMAYYCLHFGCPHFVGDELNYDHDLIRADEPKIWQNTTKCPECGSRGTRQVEQYEMHVLDWSGEPGHSLVVETCEECVDEVMEAVES